MAVIVALQGVIQVTNQVSLTVAILVLLLDQLTFLIVALLGAIVAVNWYVCQAVVKFILLAFNVILVTCINGKSYVTLFTMAFINNLQVQL